MITSRAIEAVEAVSYRSEELHAFRTRTPHKFMKMTKQEQPEALTLEM
jgi:hypothetical protein